MEPQDASAVLECPECKQQSLLFDPYLRVYECKNEVCKASYSVKDWERTQKKLVSD